MNNKQQHQEQLMFTFRGNGVGVCDKSREEYGDYISLAHISYERKITYYTEVSDNARARIEKFVKEDNISNINGLASYSALKPIQNNQ